MSDLNYENVPPRSQLSLVDRMQMVLALLPAPVLVLWALVEAPFTTYGKSKSWKRIAIDRVTLRLMSAMNRKQLRAFFGPTSKAYSDFMKSKNLPPVVDNIGEDARLFWIGPQKGDRVLLYIHGGAFIFGAIASSPAFWYYIQESLRKRDKPVSIAMLDYTLVPDRTFPTQLIQSVLAIQHIVDSGVNPENIQIAGDSAGAAIIHQVLSHMLHPVEGVPALKLSAPFGGTYMMSPWVRLRDTPDQVLKTKLEGAGDFITRRTGLYWGETVLESVPDSALPYVDANTTPKDWLKGVYRCTRRILISAGGAEVLRDEIIRYAQTMGSNHEDTTIIVQDNGIHDDPLFDFLVGEKDLGTLTPAILNWLDVGF